MQLVPRTKAIFKHAFDYEAKPLLEKYYGICRKGLLSTMINRSVDQSMFCLLGKKKCGETFDVAPSLAYDETKLICFQRNMIKSIQRTELKDDILCNSCNFVVHKLHL